MGKSYFFGNAKLSWDLLTCTRCPCKNITKTNPKNSVPGTSMLSILEMPLLSMLLKTPTPAICLPLEKGPLSPTSTNQECCAVTTALFTEKKKKKIRFHCFFMCYSCLNERLQILQSFSILFLLCFQITGIHLGNARRRKILKTIDLPGGKLYISFPAK